MRICCIADANSIHTRRWVEPFIQEGNEISLVSYRPVATAWQGLEELIDLTKLSSVPKLRFLQWGIWLRRYVRELQPDILHAHQIQGAGWLGALTGYHPFVVSTWGSDVLIEPHKSRFRRYLVDYVLGRADRVTAPSAMLYKALLDLGVREERLRLIPWGIDTTVFSPRPQDRLETRRQWGIDEHAWVVLSSRGISPLYEQHTVIEATKMLVAHIHDLRLVMLRYNVDSDYQRELERQIGVADLSAKVVWLPAQNSRAEMARLYRMADVTISVPTSEGYGASVYEALACGCPTVISDLPIFREDVEDRLHVLKVPIGCPGAVAEAILTLHSQPDLYTSLVSNGQRYAQRLGDADRMIQSKRLYEELLGNSGCEHRWPV